MRPLSHSADGRSAVSQSPDTTFTQLWILDSATTRGTTEVGLAMAVLFHCEQVSYRSLG